MNCPNCPYKTKCYMKCATPKKKIKAFSPIKQFSKKRAKENKKYLKLKDEFLTHFTTCPVTGMPATEVHHKMGRIGFADDWARLNNTSLLIDVRYFLAVSNKGHREIEDNPKWAIKNGYSVKRLENRKERLKKYQYKFKK